MPEIGYSAGNAPSTVVASAAKALEKGRVELRGNVAHRTRKHCSADRAWSGMAAGLKGPGSGGWRKKRSRERNAGARLYRLRKNSAQKDFERAQFQPCRNKPFISLLSRGIRPAKSSSSRSFAAASLVTVTGSDPPPKWGFCIPHMWHNQEAKAGFVMGSGSILPRRSREFAGGKPRPPGSGWLLQPTGMEKVTGVTDDLMRN
jgi:hypothetical protein